MKNNYVLLLSIFVILSRVFSESPVQFIPTHPSQLHFDSLKWSVPTGDPYRTVLQNGLKTYVATDSTLPLTQISGFVKYGSLMDPKGKEGLSSLLATILRSGGTTKYPADTLDKLIDQLAMKFSFSSNEASFNFNVSFLSQYSDTAFDVLQQMLFYPVFDEKKIEKKRALYIESIRHRFDNPGPTLDAAYQKLMYPNSSASLFSTEKSMAAITRDDLVKMHSKYFLSNNITFSIAGPFDRKAMIQRLEKSLSKPGTVIDTSFPKITCKPELKSLLVYKPISQAYVRIGIPLFKRPDPDYYSVSILNLIIGGGGFTSRLGTKIRSDEGLTYSIYSTAESNYTYPGTFYIDYYTKNQSFARATSLTFKEIDKILKDGVTADELSASKSMLTGELPSMFRSPFDIVSTYAWNEYYGRSPDHFVKYADELKKITREDILRVAKKYIIPEKMVMTVVGDTSALLNIKDSTFSLQNLKPQNSIDASKIPQLQ
jgi:zinc protease